MENLCQASPTTGAPIDLPHLPRSAYAYGPNGFTREIPVGRNTNVTGYPFLEGTQVVSSLLFFLYSSCISQPLSQHCPLSIRPTLQEYEELVWLARNLKLEVTEYSRQLYGGEGVNDDNDDGGGDGAYGSGGSESTPNYQPRKRLFR